MTEETMNYLIEEIKEDKKTYKALTGKNLTTLKAILFYLRCLLEK